MCGVKFIVKLTAQQCIAMQTAAFYVGTELTFSLLLSYILSLFHCMHITAIKYSKDCD